MREAAIQLGMENDPRTEANAEILETGAVAPRAISPADPDAAKDFFIERDGQRYAGVHLIIDLWGAEGLDDIDHVETALRDCVAASGATLLHIHLHHFSPSKGVSGVAVLAESHISVHTWPENGFAAFDVFMCGETEPHRSVEVLQRAFRPHRLEVGEHLRGRAE